MVKKIIDIVFPVRALPIDANERAKVISEYEMIIRRDNYQVAKAFIYIILIWGLGAVPITRGFNVFNTLVLICVLFPIALYVMALILFITNKIRGIPLLSKSYYFVYLLLIDILGTSGFNILVSALDTSYDYTLCLILLCIVLASYYVGYWFFLLKFISNTVKYSDSPHQIGIAITLGLIGCLIIKFFSLDLRLAAECLCGFLLAIVPAYKFVNYRQYDNIQHAKNGEPFK